MQRYYGETDEELAQAKKIERGYRIAAWLFFPIVTLFLFAIVFVSVFIVERIIAFFN